MNGRPPLEWFGRGLLIVGLVLAAAGLLLVVAARLGWPGKLPGDVVFHRGRLTVVIPLATSLLLSLILTLILNLILRR